MRQNYTTLTRKHMGIVLTWVQPCLAAPLTYSHQHTKKYKAAFCVVGTGLFPGTGLSAMEGVASCNSSRLLERGSTGWTGHLCRAKMITKENNARTQPLGWDVSQGAQCTYATDNCFGHGNTRCLLCKLCNCLYKLLEAETWWEFHLWKGHLAQDVWSLPSRVDWQGSPGSGAWMLWVTDLIWSNWFDMK